MLCHHVCVCGDLDVCMCGVRVYMSVSKSFVLLACIKDAIDVPPPPNPVYVPSVKFTFTLKISNCSNSKFYFIERFLSVTRAKGQ